METLGCPESGLTCDKKEWKSVVSTDSRKHSKFLLSQFFNVKKCFLFLHSCVLVFKDYKLFVLKITDFSQNLLST